MRETLDGSLLVAHETEQFPEIEANKHAIIVSCIISTGSIHLAFYILLKTSLDSTPQNWKMMVGHDQPHS